MSANKNLINVSLLGGWGACDFDVASGVVDAGGVVVQVQAVSCHWCAHPFKVGDSVAIVRFDDAAKKERAYHMSCLPLEYGFALPALSGKSR